MKLRLALTTALLTLSVSAAFASGNDFMQELILALASGTKVM